MEALSTRVGAASTFMAQSCGPSGSRKAEPLASDPFSPVVRSVCGSRFVGWGEGPLWEQGGRKLSPPKLEANVRHFVSLPEIFGRASIALVVLWLPVCRIIACGVTANHRI